MKEFHGILEIDYPGLTDNELRDIQLNDPETHLLPDGKSVAEYANEVIALKESRLAVLEAAEITPVSIQPEEPEKQKKDKGKKAETETPPIE